MTTHDGPLLRVQALTKEFGRAGFPWSRRRSVVHALSEVSLSVEAGKTLAIVGESGSGKTTLGRCVMRLYEATSGHVWFEGQDVMALDRRALRVMRRDLQMVFQDPSSSLNPRMTVEQIVREPLDIHDIGHSRADRRARVLELLANTGLPASALTRRPHEFSGGQRQRIGIARALASRPKLIVADEPVSALDVSIQAQIVNLFSDLQKAQGLALLFISHDLKVVRYLAQEVAVMYLGQIVEVGPTEALFAAPAHPYTRALLSAVPRVDPTSRRLRVILDGDPPSPLAPPSGCRFHPRCSIFAELKDPRCTTEMPRLESHASGHPHPQPSWKVACHHPGASPELAG